MRNANSYVNLCSEKHHRFSFLGYEYIYFVDDIAYRRLSGSEVIAWDNNKQNISSEPDSGLHDLLDWWETTTKSSGDKSQPLGLKYLSLHVAHRCLLNCTYCYGVGGTYGRKTTRMMTEEIMKYSVDFLLRNLGDNETGHINFFGGEPLANFKLIKKTVKYALEKFQNSGKGLDFSVSTSGVILDEGILEFLRNYKFAVSLSIDGTRENHDRFRVFSDGSGSYDLVVKNGKKLEEACPNVLITATLTRQTKQLEENLDSIVSQGFRNVRFKIATDVDKNLQITARDLPELMQSYKRLLPKYLNDLNSGVYYDFGDITKWMHRLILKKRIIRNCDAGVAFLNVDPEGDVFICHKFIPRAIGKLSNVNTDISWDQSLLENVNVNQTKCNHCWAKYLCGGGCYFDGFSENGSIRNTAGTMKCELYKFLIEAAVHTCSELGESTCADIIEKLYARKNSYETIV